MKKVLILANFDVGLYKFRKELIQELLQQQNKVYISLPDGELVRPLEKMGCVFIDTPLERRGMNPITDGKLILRYQQMIKKIKPDLVITYTIKPNIYGGLACRLTKTNYACNITGLGTAFQKEGLLKKMVVFLYKRALKKAKTVFFENQTNRNIFLNNQIIPKSKTVVLSGAGVNLEEYSFEEYPSEKDGLHFLFIGRVMKEKGIDELFLAAEKLAEKNLEEKSSKKPANKKKEMYFDIVGPCEEDYKETLQNLEHKGILKWHGYQEDVKPFIKQAHCFVLPSWHEGMANTLLESAAMGRPLITSDIPGCREAIAPNKGIVSNKGKAISEEIIENKTTSNTEAGIQTQDQIKIAQTEIQIESKTKNAWSYGAKSKNETKNENKIQMENGKKRYVIKRGANGLLCQPKNTDSLSNAIEQFCSLSEEERKAMGVKSRGWMEKKFDKRKVVEETMKGLGL